MFSSPSQKNKTPLDEKALRHKAIELLARREYSYGELEQKLLPLTDDENKVYHILDWLVEMGLQSDARFAEMYIRSKALSGYGPVRIKMELKQKYLSDHLIEMGFESLESELDWSGEVDRLIQKKAVQLKLSDIRDKNKLMGFLQRRGFSLDQIYSGIDRIEQE